jgi:hypothetical protein
MKRGKTERETLELNGWKVGDILEGDEGYGPSRILITAIGDEKFLCRWDNQCEGVWEPSESGSTTLSLSSARAFVIPLKLASSAAFASFLVIPALSAM